MPLSHLRSRLTYANVIAALALFIALGGTSYAALKWPKNSVGTPQLKNGSVTSAKIRNGSLNLADLDPAAQAELRGPAGAPGPAGPAGPAGATGPTGARGATDVVVRRHEDGPLAAGAFDGLVVFCKPGERATGGGVGFTENGGNEIVQQSFPVKGAPTAVEEVQEGDTPTGWFGRIKNGNGVALAHPVVWALCVSP